MSRRTTTTRTLRLRLKDKHARFLCSQAREVNMVWNFVNELSCRILQRERRFASAFDLAPYTKGATKAGLSLHSQTVQAVTEEYVTRRQQFKKAKLRWRVSGGSRRSLGWIPVKASALRYKAGQVWYGGQALSLWDSYGLADYALGTGSFSEDARGRWYLNVTVEVEKTVSKASGAVGLDLGLKDFLATSDGHTEGAQRFYRDLETALAVAQRAGKKQRVKAIHAKIAARRKNALHQLSTRLVNEYGAIFIGNVNASALAKTKMAKSVLDAGWSAFRTMLQYKCDDVAAQRLQLHTSQSEALGRRAASHWRATLRRQRPATAARCCIEPVGVAAGVWFEEVNEAYSTQTCSCCASRTGPKGVAGLGIRGWTCSDCGSVHDRDVNAAKNILAVGRDRLAGGICDPK